MEQPREPNWSSVGTLPYHLKAQILGQPRKALGLKEGSFLARGIQLSHLLSLPVGVAEILLCITHCPKCWESCKRANWDPIPHKPQGFGNTARRIGLWAPIPWLRRRNLLLVLCHRVFLFRFIFLSDSYSINPCGNLNWDLDLLAFHQQSHQGLFA